MYPSGLKLTKFAGVFALASQLACGAAISNSAQAADLLGDEIVDQTDVEFGTGWYLRGDISVSFTDELFGSDTSQPVPGTMSQLINSNEEETLFGASAAVGFRLNNNLRFDISAERIGRGDSSTQTTTITPVVPCTDAFALVTQVDANGNTITTTIGGPGGGIVITNCVESASASFDMNAAGANLFYDFDSRFLGARPFVGVGLNVVRNNFTSETGTITCTAPGEFRCNPTDGGTAQFGEAYTQIGSRDNGISYHFAPSVTAGLAFEVSENFYVDASYRYTHIIESPFSGDSTSLNNTGAPQDLHALKLGVRLEIW